MENQTTKITVKGMHCNACVAMVKMELEDRDLKQYIRDVALIEGENKGTVELATPNEPNLPAIKEAINSAGEYECE